ncbi:C4-dicarboxylate ABC transporter permease [candidate division KSB3 bacterium]|uniref:C4-dicarboxylate ABC transporter permease n=1 Tax=candidate division KSB3 bacterium TaxID=2044937 RepID=A0A2G6E1X0_9BACT|nr:MAG: C4-dicarboxylate ABC transporter permease [candidate division KSB3 bacterium]PIE28643.1 MAG: C4-dicarboxylate ABC transporter permease [candidate division KSB3 bacterium]
MGFVLLGMFLLLTALGVPVAFALCLAVAIVLFFFMDMPLVMVTQIMYAGIDSFSFMAVPFFMLAGAFMSAGGVTARLVTFSQSLVGSFTGGLAQTVSVSGCFFAAISGSSAATTAALGSTMIDELEKKNYSREWATGIVASSGVVGIVIPPSITLVVYGVIADTSIGDLFIGGFIPGILMGISMMLVSWYLAKKRGLGAEGTFSFKAILISFKNSFFALMTPVIIIGGIYGGIFTPTEAAAVAAVYGIFVGLFIYKELQLQDFPKIIFQAVKGTTLIMFLVGAANVFGWLVTNLQIPQQVATLVVSITSSPLVFLLMMNVLLLFIGTLVNASAAVVILTPIFLPVAKTLGIDPLFFGVLMVVNLAIGCITPPVGLDLFVASAISKVSIERVMKATLPYLYALLVVLMLLTLFPSFITVLPNVLR